MKNMKMTPETRALLSILIHEVQSELPKGSQAVNELLDSWIKANDLPIHEVQTVTIKEFRESHQKPRKPSRVQI